jgi:hypothetical protein
MWPAVIVAIQVGIENGLHLFDGLEPGTAAFDAEVLVEQRAVQALDDAVCSEPTKLDRYWLESPAPVPRLGGARSDEGLTVLGRPEGVHSEAGC